MNPDDRPRTDGGERINRRAYLWATGVTTAGMAGLAGCLGDDDEADRDDENGSDNGTADDADDTGENGDTESAGLLATSITDQPGDIADFESCIVTIDGMWIKPRGGNGGTDSDDESDSIENGDEGDANGDDAGDESEGIDEQDEDDVDQSQGRRYMEFAEPETADLVQLQGDNTQLIDEREVEPGSYQFLQLDISAVEGIHVDGGEVSVDTPGSAPLQFKERFEIREGERTSFLADFTPVRRGTGEYHLQPVASGTEVAYEPR